MKNMHQNTSSNIKIKTEGENTKTHEKIENKQTEGENTKTHKTHKKSLIDKIGNVNSPTKQQGKLTNYAAKKTQKHVKHKQG